MTNTTTANSNANTSVMGIITLVRAGQSALAARMMASTPVHQAMLIVADAQDLLSQSDFAYLKAAIRADASITTTESAAS